jgi:hypothetical protein
MKRTLLALATTFTFAAAAHADTSAGAPKAPVGRDALVAGFFYLIGTVAEQDDKSPVKAETSVWESSGEKNITVGLKDFQGSITVVRSAVGYGVLRAAGQDVSPPQKPESAWRVANLLAFDKTNREKMEQAFKDLTGVPIIKKKIVKDDRVLNQYSAAGLKAAFEKLYVPPSTELGGVRAQTIYDTLFKTFVRKEANAMALLLERRDFIARKSKTFVAHSLESDVATEEQYKLAQELGGPLGEEPRLIGMVLRRHADGTLPQVITMLRTILKDFDRETFNKLDARLKAPSA